MPQNQVPCTADEGGCPIPVLTRIWGHLPIRGTDDIAQPGAQSCGCCHLVWRLLIIPQDVAILYQRHAEAQGGCLLGVRSWLTFSYILHTFCSGATTTVVALLLTYSSFTRILIFYLEAPILLGSLEISAICAFSACLNQRVGLSDCRMSHCSASDLTDANAFSCLAIEITKSRGDHAEEMKNNEVYTSHGSTEVKN